MKTVGLITEYNPFHNGHKYHIEEARNQTGADYVIAVMSGNFVQRGFPAMLDKYTRAEMALRNGVDLVFELPVCYSAGSARYFAYGAVSLLHKLGIVDALCFGSECGDLSLLRQTAKQLSEPPEDFKESLKSSLRDGLSYPAARLQALYETGSIDKDSPIIKILKEPNNILGIEYLNALCYFQSGILPLTIKRVVNHYHDSNLTAIAPSEPSLSRDSALCTNPQDDSQVISSATAIRKSIEGIYEADENAWSKLRESLPPNVCKLLKSHYLKTYPITEEDFSVIIKYKLLTEDKSDLIRYLDISNDLADRLKNRSDFNLSLSDLIGSIKTRNMTQTRINRALFHLLLNLRTEDVKEYNTRGYVSYARLLGMRKHASRLLRSIKEQGQLSIITKVARAGDALDASGKRMLSSDITAAHIYNQAVYEKYHYVIPNEYQHGIVIL